MRPVLVPVRAVRAALAAACTGALVLCGATALPAAAEPVAVSPGTTVRVVGADHSLTAAWPAVAGATGYTVRVSTSPSLAKARTVVTTERTVRVRGLRNGRPYYVGVAAADLRVSPSAVRTTKPKTSRTVVGPGVPYPVGTVTAVPGPLKDQVTVSWTGGGRASKVAVIAGSNVITDERSFSSGWFPATTRSITITVPEEFRAYLGGGTGNPVWVKVAQSNSTSTAFGAYYDGPRSYRPSPVGTWAFAKAEAPAATAVSKLKVAELNIQSFGATGKYTAANRWKARAPRAAAYVNTGDPDVLLTAELATNLTKPCTNSEAYAPYRCAPHTQMADLARRLTRLKVAGTDAYARIMDEMRGFGGRWTGRATDGAHVFYDPAKLTVVDHGYFSPALTPAQSFKNVTGLGVSNWTGRNAIGPDRWLSWARFRTNDGANREFYAVAGHFPVGDAKEVVDARQEEAKKLAAAIDALAGDLPVVLGADMNADAVRSPKAAQVVFMRHGWFDASAVADKRMRSGMKVSTANGSGAQNGVDAGYGSKPVRHPYETSRIDYILLRNSPYTFRYANVLRLNSDGTFKKDLQGTDHNMQLAVIGIASPAPVAAPAPSAAPTAASTPTDAPAPAASPAG